MRRGEENGSKADEEDNPESDATDRPEEDGRPRDGGPEATEAARNKARELGVDLSGLEGTGSGGRIIVKDVVKAAKG